MFVYGPNYILHNLDQAETVSRRVEKFAELMQSVWLSKNDYERQVRAVSMATPGDSKSLTS